MITAAAIALFSIPFALVVLAGTCTAGAEPKACNRDAFVVAYAAALGLILSLIVLWDGRPAIPMPRLGIIQDAPGPNPADHGRDASRWASVSRPHRPAPTG